MHTPFRSIHLHTYRRRALALLIATAAPFAAAQGLQTGPELLRGGADFVQPNVGDAAYDPQELQNASLLGTDEVRDGQNPDARGGNLPGAGVYAEVPDREGIVDVKFTVKADGSVSDVEVLGGFYDDAFRQRAVDGVAASNFDPPKSGDNAIDWPNYRMRVILRAPILPSVSPEVAAELERVKGMYAAQDYAAAEPLLNDLLATKAQTLFDYALLQDQLASVYVRTERPHEALVALRNATSDSKAMPPQSRSDSRLQIQEERYPDEYLLPELYVKALERQFGVAAALNQTGEAVAIAEELDARGDVPPALREQADQIIAKLGTEDPIGSQIKLVNGSWTYVVSSRRIFGMTGLQGKVDFVDIACGDNRRRRMAFTNDSEFALPASWENCKLEFLGDDGATFLLYEYLK
jgi:hypothetical protein